MSSRMSAPTTQKAHIIRYHLVRSENPVLADKHFSLGFCHQFDQTVQAELTSLHVTGLTLAILFSMITKKEEYSRCSAARLHFYLASTKPALLPTTIFFMVKDRSRPPVGLENGLCTGLSSQFSDLGTVHQALITQTNKKQTP